MEKDSEIPKLAYDAGKIYLTSEDMAKLKKSRESRIIFYRSLKSKKSVKTDGIVEEKEILSTTISIACLIVISLSIGGLINSKYIFFSKFDYISAITYLCLGVIILVLIANDIHGIIRGDWILLLIVESFLFFFGVSFFFFSDLPFIIFISYIVGILFSLAFGGSDWGWVISELLRSLT